ncbi:PAS domain S-box protein [Polaromonas sp.]|uniref:PAS domain S-box protein n=1 Tax=Polaromonas sp. TaxID=1869339 RepID=UPI003CB28A24
MTRDEELIQANERLAAQALELSRQQLALDALRTEVQNLRSLAAISGYWYWAQDTHYRFTEFAAARDAGLPDTTASNDAIGHCPWDLPGLVPVSASWEAHRAVLDAREPFRDFEYMRPLAGEPPRYFSVTGMPLFDKQGQFTGYRGTTHDISARKRLEEAQRQAVDFLDLVVDNIPFAFHMKSAQEGHPVVMWNQAAQALYGLKREEAIGRTVYELWPRADAERMHAADQEVMDSGEPQDFPDRMVATAHRGLIHVHLRKVPLKDASGVVTHILITAEDITERLAIEDSLRHSQERFRSLTQLSSDWYWEVDDQFRFTVLSGGTTDAIKASIARFLGKARWEIGRTPGDQVVWAAHRAQLERHETFRDFEYEREDDDGRRVLCISGEPVFDDGGKFTGYRGVGTDITARKRAEAGLRASETRFRTVIAVLAEGVLLRDADGKIVDCNASAERILGRTLAQLKGSVTVDSGWQMLREDGSLLPEEERPSTIAIRTGRPQSNVVICYRKPDDSTLWVLLNLQPLFERGPGAPSGFVTTITDISKRKRDEMEIVRLNVDLENRVLRRTVQLEAANRELEAFSYSVAHDLRSPLSSIDGYSALLQKALPPAPGERINHYLTRIRAGVQRMGELTDGLLALAQLSRTSLKWEWLDLSEEAAKIIRQWAESDPSRLVEATIEPDMTVRADISLLRQVLENLIANAWKFSSKKSLTKISVGKESGADQEVVYFVRDNGAGFDMAYADKLFGTFQRLHSPEEFAGSGIGLATVKRIITRHGGRIWATSVLGEGSTFYFTIGSEQQVAASDADTLDDSRIALAQAPRSRYLFQGATGASISSDNDAFTIRDQQFSNAFEHAAIGMALIAVDSRRLRVNGAFCQMLGYSEAEMMSRTIHDITHPDDIEWDLVQRARALAGEIETYQWEKRYIHRSGSIVWGYLSCSLVRDTDRQPLHFIVQVQDITERKLTEQGLRESEERFRALTELSSDWFWQQDENFRFVQVSGEAPHMAAISRMAIGKTPWELNHVGMDDSVWAAYRARLERHEPFRDVEIPQRDRKGRVRYISISGAPIFDASGRFTGYHGTGRDNTEIRRVTEALRVSEAQLRDITDTLPASISYVDANQRFRFHNRAYAEGLGLSREEIDGRTMREVLGEEGYELARPWIEEVLSGYPVTFERHRKTPNGDFRDFIVNYFPRYGDGAEEGQVIGFYALGTDVTELKRIDRMKNEFVSTVSHELRTPLTSIRGSLGLIAGGVAGELPEAVKTLVGIARNNCERLIRLINDILDIEKIESGKMHLDFQVVELKPLLVQVLAANEGFGAAQNVSLQLRFPDQDLWLRVDSDRLAQVMTNLLSNAMKFSPPGGVVEVHVLQVGPGVRVEVRDHGPGIPEEFSKRIFQKFSQADSSDARGKGGTGLGLNISRAIVERLGGSIGFETGAGTGTTFYFELPEWKKLPAPTPGGHAGTGPLRPRILICEDDQDIARLISMMLDKGGFDADMAYSAAQALELLAQTSYAAMTVDLKLPDQDGITLIRHLRAQAGTKDLPIVVVSAGANQGQIQLNNQLLTVSDWLEKPINENLLVLGLRRAIAGAEGKPRILHVEDDLDIQRITAAIAQDFATFEFAATLQEARTRLNARRFDLILLDLTLPEGSGWDLLADIASLKPPPPVVVFTAGEVEREQGMQAAAVLVKAQTSNAELLETLQRALARD